MVFRNLSGFDNVAGNEWTHTPSGSVQCMIVCLVRSGFVCWITSRAAHAVVEEMFRD